MYVGWMEQRANHHGMYGSSFALNLQLRSRDILVLSRRRHHTWTMTSKDTTRDVVHNNETGAKHTKKVMSSDGKIKSQRGMGSDIALIVTWMPGGR